MGVAFSSSLPSPALRRLDAAIPYSIDDDDRGICSTWRKTPALLFASRREREDFLFVLYQVLSEDTQINAETCEFRLVYMRRPAGPQRQPLDWFNRTSEHVFASLAITRSDGELAVSKIESRQGKSSRRAAFLEFQKHVEWLFAQRLPHVGEFGRPHECEIGVHIAGTRSGEIRLGEALDEVNRNDDSGTAPPPSYESCRAGDDKKWSYSSVPSSNLA